MQKGLYDQLINNNIETKLSLIKNELSYDKESVDKAESSEILSRYIEKVMKIALSQISGSDSISSQIKVCNNIINNLAESVDDELKDLLINKEAEILLSVVDKINEKINKKIIRPVTSISETSLFTGAPNEPSLGSELKKEIKSSDTIDILVSFIRWSGLRLIMNELTEFSKTNKLRVITTSYMGATELKAIEFLSKLHNTEVKISYDNKRTRLHAKSYYFKRNTGYSTAYIGSSNLSRAAISSGLEWNVKVSEQTSKHIFEKFNATFEAYWNDSEFESFDYKKDKDKLKEALSASKYKSEDIKYLFDIRPYSYQREILDKLDAERKVHNNYRNLIIAATGTGKTVVSAFDYKKIYNNKDNKLLFIAHRKEILIQSIETFRGVLKEANFGDLWVGRHKPTQFDHLFVSIQSLNSKKLWDELDKKHFDYIVIDETHHVAASSYQKLLDHFKPEILLGLTATPERMDQDDIFKYFNNKASAEIRLGEAINRKLLSPFHYFGVTDDIDLSHLKWERGGYNTSELTNIYTKNEQRIDLIIKALEKYIGSFDEIKGLGFCVSKKHAEFMAKMFNRSNIPSINLDSDSSKELRNNAKHRLNNGEIKFIFVVDLYNEGVDIPDINTVLFLRPTESLTIFLQQLGRGLRLSDNKECLTVLDFIGQAHMKYNFEEKIRGLIGKTHNSTKKEIENQFPNVPKGCYINLEKVAQERIIENIKSAIPNKRNIKKKLIQFKLDSKKGLNLKNFLDFYHLDIFDIYKFSTFSRLCVDVNIKEDFNDPDEKLLSSGLKRLVHIDSVSWINALLSIFKNKNKNKNNKNNKNKKYNKLEEKMILMLHYTLFQDSPMKLKFNNYQDIIDRIKLNKVMYKELIEILEYKKEKIDFIEKDITKELNFPLKVNSQYSRDELLAGLGDYTFNKKPSRREGVVYIKDKKTDVLLVTLHKSEKDFSPTTMYEDYAIDSYNFHWQSQSKTPDTSNTGKRYINHKKIDNKILLFVREYKNENSYTQPYYFLGKVNYVSHQGSKPMSIVWRLEEPMTQALKTKSSSGSVVG